MIKFWIMLLTLAILLVLGPVLSEHQGFVHISFENYIVEMSVVSALIIIVVFFCLSFFIFGLIGRSLGLKKGMISWFGKNRRTKSQKLLEQSLISFIEGNYLDCLDKSTASSSWTEFPLMAVYLRFKSLTLLGDVERCESLLSEMQSDESNSYMLALMRVDMYLNNSAFQNAFNVITAMRKQYKVNKVISSLFLRCCIGLKKYDLIEKNRKEFLKFNVITKAEYNEYIIKRITDEIEALSDPFVINKMIEEIPKDIIETLEVSLAIASRLNKIGQKDQALKLLFKQFKKTVDITRIYEHLANWNSSDPKIIAYLENIRNMNKEGSENNIELDKALANMYMQEHDYKLALALYDGILSKQPSAEVYGKYGFCVSKSQK